MELKASNLIYSGCNIDSLAFDRLQAEVVYKLLLEMGATGDIKFNWDEDTGKIHIMKKFVYPSAMIDGEDKVGDQFYTLEKYLKILIRFDRAAHKRMSNVKGKINKMYNLISKLEKQL